MLYYSNIIVKNYNQSFPAVILKADVWPGSGEVCQVAPQDSVDVLTQTDDLLWRERGHRGIS